MHRGDGRKHAGDTCGRSVRQLAILLLRLEEGSEFLTDGGNYILDCSFGPIADAVTLGREIDSIPGVIEHGLFVGMASKVFIGATKGVLQYSK